jgi:peroxiredoxin family protein
MQLRPHQSRACHSMLAYDKGQIIFPTGGGKTLTMIYDLIENCKYIDNGMTTVVVAPRILLAEQLSAEFLEFVDTKYTHVMHVHSGETHHFSTTNPEKIALFNNTARAAGENVLIFTTYNSLDRIRLADIEVNTIYFDEAHNSVKKNFFPATEHFSYETDRCYFFTATPKHSLTPNKPGMNIPEVYGQVISKVPAPELIQGGFIIPPKVKATKISTDISNVADRDCKMIIEILRDEDDMDKVMVAAKATKHIQNLMTQTQFMPLCNALGYDVLWITAKWGAFINGKKVNREVFFDTMNEWGQDPTRKFIMFHHSILSEGINVSGLTACILMRNMDVITMAQTIGRVIRLNKDDASDLRTGKIAAGNLDQYRKPFGKMFVPVYSNVGISTHRTLQNVVDTIFCQGEPAISKVRK